MSVHARVALVKAVPAGEGVSYGHTYKILKDTNLALVPLGYADGVPALREQPRPGRDRRQGPPRGRAGSAWTRSWSTAATTTCARRRGRALRRRRRGEPTADDWATAADTINYEIVARMGSNRTPRVYVGEQA